MAWLQELLRILSENATGLTVLAALVSAGAALVVAWFGIGILSIHRMERARGRADMARLSVLLVKSATEVDRFYKVTRGRIHEEDWAGPLLAWHKSFGPMVRRMLLQASNAPPETMAFLHIAGTQTENLRSFVLKYRDGGLDAVQQERVLQMIESLNGILLRANIGIPRRHRKLGPIFRRKEYAGFLDAAADWTKKKYPESLP